MGNCKVGENWNSLQVMEKDEPDKEEDNETTKMWMTLWVSFCVSAAFWFISKMMRGRRNLQNNFAFIQQELERMQKIIEQREEMERDRSLKYKEDDDGKTVTDENGVVRENNGEDPKEESGSKSENELILKEDDYDSETTESQDELGQFKCEASKSSDKSVDKKCTSHSKYEEESAIVDDVEPKREPTISKRKRAKSKRLALETKATGGTKIKLGDLKSNAVEKDEAVENCEIGENNEYSKNVDGGEVKKIAEIRVNDVVTTIEDANKEI